MIQWSNYPHSFHILSLTCICRSSLPRHLQWLGSFALPWDSTYGLETFQYYAPCGWGCWSNPATAIAIRLWHLSDDGWCNGRSSWWLCRWILLAWTIGEWGDWRERRAEKFGGLCWCLEVLTSGLELSSSRDLHTPNRMSKDGTTDNVSCSRSSGSKHKTVKNKCTTVCRAVLKRNILLKIYQAPARQWLLYFTFYSTSSASGDMWSAGLILYAMCFGDLPYHSEDPAECRRQVVSHKAFCERVCMTLCSCSDWRMFNHVKRRRSCSIMFNLVHLHTVLIYVWLSSESFACRNHDIYTNTSSLGLWDRMSICSICI